VFFSWPTLFLHELLIILHCCRFHFVTSTTNLHNNHDDATVWRLYKTRLCIDTMQKIVVSDGENVSWNKTIEVPTRRCRHGWRRRAAIESIHRSTCPIAEREQRPTCWDRHCWTHNASETSSGNRNRWISSRERPGKLQWNRTSPISLAFGYIHRPVFW